MAAFVVWWTYRQPPHGWLILSENLWEFSIHCDTVLSSYTRANIASSSLMIDRSSWERQSAASVVSCVYERQTVIMRLQFISIIIVCPLSRSSKSVTLVCRSLGSPTNRSLQINSPIFVKLIFVKIGSAFRKFQQWVGLWRCWVREISNLRQTTTARSNSNLLGFRQLVFGCCDRITIPGSSGCRQCRFAVWNVNF